MASLAVNSKCDGPFRIPRSAVTCRAFMSPCSYQDSLQAWAKLIKKLRIHSKGFSNSPSPKKRRKLSRIQEAKVPPMKFQTKRNLRKRKKQGNKDASSVTSNLESEESFSSSGRKRRRKNSDQINVLLKHFEKNPKWDRRTIENAAKESGLSISQAYKWGWDRKNKAGDLEGFHKPSKDEFGGYSKHDFTDQDDSIAQLIGKNLDKEVEKLLFEHNHHHPVQKVKSVTQPKTPQKKRTRKLMNKKREEDISNNTKHDTEVQTPDLWEPKEEDFVTPVKGKKHSEIGHVQVAHNLFPADTENIRDSKVETERKLDFSENSLCQRSFSDISSRRLQCRENLDLQKENILGSQADLIGRPTKKQIASFQHPVLLKEIENRKPFGNLSKNFSRTPEQVTPPEESLLGVNLEEMNCRNSINMSLLEFDFVSDPPSQEMKPSCIPFNIEEDMKIGEEKSQEMLSKERYTSFPDLPSSDSELANKLGLGAGFNI
ncbi:unnamed protein product [Moneuplotes crassus]|uniref:Homeobox domain-containing protein n=1 Tax=Euplotes crassus TaxID=5936 RepID=A0AAD1U519_EUPCR|nr:unnamed protein product [Moneuplotes crassus]